MAQSYNTETYSINPKATRIIRTQKDTGYVCFNVGRGTSKIEIIQGDMFKWTDTIISNVFTSGTGSIFQIGLRPKFVAVRVTNQDDIRAFIHVSGVNNKYKEFVDPEDANSFPLFNIDGNALLRTAAVFGIGYIPVVGSVLAVTVDFFWPSADTPDVWSEIKDKVSNAIDKKAQETVKGILGVQLNYMHQRIKTCSKEIEDPNLTTTIASHYMNIAEDLVGFEKLFIITLDDKTENIKTNYILLPLYSATVDMIASYYHYGILNQQKVGLNDEHINRIKNYTKDVARDGEIHVKKVFDDMFKLQYENCNPEIIYDPLATVRAYCTLGGFEHVALWKAIADNPTETKKPEVSDVVYSTCFGRNNAIQSHAMVVTNVPAPLLPKTVNGKLTNPTSLDVILTNSPTPSIGGLKITYDNGDVYNVGKKKDGNTHRIDLNGRKIIKLKAFGTGQINGLLFTLSDGATESVGTNNGDSHEFYLEKHHIVGFFLGSSTLIDKETAANISVSYQLDHN